jgi:hypothetical protein
MSGDAIRAQFGYATRGAVGAQARPHTSRGADDAPATAVLARDAAKRTTRSADILTAEELSAQRAGEKGGKSQGESGRGSAGKRKLAQTRNSLARSRSYHFPHSHALTLRPGYLLSDLDDTVMRASAQTLAFLRMRSTLIERLCGTHIACSGLLGLLHFPSAMSDVLAAATEVFLAAIARGEDPREVRLTSGGHRH